MPLSVPGLPLPKNDYEQKIIDLAKRALDDIPECRDGKFAVRWNQDARLGSAAPPIPFLTIEFAGFEDCIAAPAVGICLVAVQKNTLLEVMPGKKLLEGDRLRDHILHSVHHYLQQHGIVLTLPDHHGEHDDAHL